MTLTAFVLVVLSVFMHAGWNVVSKKSKPGIGFFLIASITSVIVMLPVYCWFGSSFYTFPPRLWLIFAMTGLCQAVYYISLAGAYRHADISQAYPMGRAMPVLMIAVITLLTRQGKPLSPLAVAGMVVIFSGCIILPLSHFREFKTSNYCNRAILFIFGVACGTTGYTLLDDRGMRLLKSSELFSAWEAAPVYIGVSTFFTSCWMLLAILPRRESRKVLTEQLRAKWRTAMLAGIAITLTYALVLAAMLFADNVSYIAAFRQLSIPLGAVMGFIFLKERATKPRIIGCLMIFSGLVLTACG